MNSRMGWRKRGRCTSGAVRAMLSVTGRSTRRRWSVDALSKAEALSELIAITPEEREEIKRRCEEKLCLTEFVTVSSDYGCDGCGAAVPS